MAIADDIAKQISIWCNSNGIKEYSRQIIREDFIDADAIEALANEIEEKLKMKGITIVA